MDTRNRTRPDTLGAVSIQLVVIMVPVIFGMMGFAVDLGRLYLIRGELNQAANAMALAAASKLIGTSGALDDANTAAQLTLDDTLSSGNKYNFGSLQIGQTTGILASSAPDPSYFSTVADAVSVDNSGGSGNADGTTAKYVQANITADAPLTFWALLSLGQMRKTQIAARAVAGVSAPLCTACGIEPFAIAPIDATDTTDFGFVVGTQYTFGYVCNGLPVPQALSGSARRIPFLLLDRYDTGSTFDESQQLYRTGAQGVIPSPTLTQACFTVNNPEVVWASATVQNCSTNQVGGSVIDVLCGLDTRFENTPPSGCTGITDIDTISSAYLPDRDVTSLDDYTAYVGSVRRVITVPIVDALNAAGSMTVQGFRQFLVEPTVNLTGVNPSDANGRFAALYIGSVVPLKQGRFDGGCDAPAGPGKVVLHQ